MIDIYSISLLDLLPENLKSDLDVAAIAQALTPELQSIAKDTALCILYDNIDSLSDEVLDLLAWDLHVDFYESNLPIDQKRSLVKQAYPWHRHKGTPWAVEQVVSIIFPTATVAEWFEYGGEPYHFRVETDQPLAVDTDLDRLVRLINATKNERSWLENVTVRRTINNGQFYGGVFAEWRKTEIYPVEFVMPDISGSQTYAGVVSISQKTEVK